MSDQRTFPIQCSYEKGVKPHPMQIPWSVAELAYSSYAARYGTSQSLERLGQRGGFGPGEMDMLLPDWRERCDEINSLLSTITSLQSRLEESEAVIGQLNIFLNSERSTVELYKSRLEAAEGENGRLKERATKEKEYFDHNLKLKSDQLEKVSRNLHQWQQSWHVDTGALRTQLTAAESRAQQAEEKAGRVVELAQKAFDAAIDMAAEHCLRIGDYSAQSRADGIRDEAHEEWEAFKKEHLSTSPPSDRTDKERALIVERYVITAEGKMRVESPASLPVAENEGRVGA